MTFFRSLWPSNLGLVVVDEQTILGLPSDRIGRTGPSTSPARDDCNANPEIAGPYGLWRPRFLHDRRVATGSQTGRTHLRFEDSRQKVIAFTREEIASGGRAFVVYPIIDASEEIEAAALTEHEEAVREALPGVGVEVLHGRLDRVKREEAISRFREGSDRFCSRPPSWKSV